MEKQTQTAILTELAKAGTLFLVMGIAVYFLYQENRIFREEMKLRIDRLEDRYDQCMQENIHILKKQNELILKFADKE
jgi:glycogen debranching enzyme